MGSPRIRVPIAVAAACLIAALAVAPGAAAQGSEFDQYVPQVPEAEGDTPVRDKKEGSRDRDQEEETQTAIPEAVVEDLAAEGVTGEAAAAAAEATAPDKKKDEGNGDKLVDRRSDASTASALAGAAAGDSDDGIGIVLPLILVGTLVAGLGYVLIVRRKSTG